MKLTKREQEVVELVARGLANQVIAEQLGIKRSTVISHLYHIYSKLNVQNRVQVLIYHLTGLTPDAEEKINSHTRNTKATRTTI